MRGDVKSTFWTDDDGNPTGGKTYLVGADIEWQNGRVSIDGHNGAFVEDVLEAVLQRIKFFNATKFRCRENSLAITKIEEALHWLDHRTKARETQGVEDSYEVHTDE